MSRAVCLEWSDTWSIQLTTSPDSIVRGHGMARSQRSPRFFWLHAKSVAALLWMT